MILYGHSGAILLDFFHGGSLSVIMTGVALAQDCSTLTLGDQGVRYKRQ